MNVSLLLICLFVVMLLEHALAALLDLPISLGLSHLAFTWFTPFFFYLL